MPRAPLREIESLDDVERRIGELWAEVASQGKAVLRACKMNLIVAAAPGEDLRSLLTEVGKVTDREPGRAIVIESADPEGPASLRPWIAAHCHLGPQSRPVCSEQIVLEVRGHAEALVREALLRLLVADMPVFVWWRGPLPGEPLLRRVLEVADRFIVNSAAGGDAARTLGTLRWITEHPRRRAHVGDLAWERTDPWREIVASMFDAEEARRHLAGLGRVRVACRGEGATCGSTGLYLAGWLASRLGWTVEGPGRARRPDGGPVEIALRSCEAAVPGRIASVHLDTEDGATFQATRTRVDGPGVRVAAPAGHALLRRVQALDDLALLQGELQRDAADPVFEAALLAAAALSGAQGGP